MTNDKLHLKTWEQQVEYKKVKDWGRAWNRKQIPEIKQGSAQDIIDQC